MVTEFKQCRLDMAGHFGKGVLDRPTRSLTCHRSHESTERRQVETWEVEPALLKAAMLNRPRCLGVP